MKHKKGIFLNCILPLFLSLVIYVLFRSEDTVVNRLLNIYFSGFHLSVKFHYFDWIIYNLPGALWLYSFIYYNTLYGKKIINSILPLVFALGIEMLQLFKITDGTFDLLDVVFYLFTWLIYIAIYKFFRNTEIVLLSNSERPLKHKLGLPLFMAIVIFSDVWPK